MSPPVRQSVRQPVGQSVSWSVGRSAVGEPTASQPGNQSASQSAAPGWPLLSLPTFYLARVLYLGLSSCLHSLTHSHSLLLLHQVAKEMKRLVNVAGYAECSALTGNGLKEIFTLVSAWRQAGTGRVTTKKLHATAATCTLCDVCWY